MSAKYEGFSQFSRHICTAIVRGYLLSGLSWEGNFLTDILITESDGFADWYSRGLASLKCCNREFESQSGHLSFFCIPRILYK